MHQYLVKSTPKYVHLDLCVSLTVCLSDCLSTTILALQATRRLMSDTNSFSGILHGLENKMAILLKPLGTFESDKLARSWTALRGPTHQFAFAFALERLKMRAFRPRINSQPQFAP